MSEPRVFTFVYRDNSRQLRTVVSAHSYPEACWKLGRLHAKMFEEQGVPADFEINLAVPGRCWVCGCMEDDCRPCIERTGVPCSWANEEHTICTACVSGLLSLGL